MEQSNELKLRALLNQAGMTPQKIEDTLNLRAGLGQKVQEILPISNSKELLNVKGLGRKSLAKIENRVKTGQINMYFLDPEVGVLKPEWVTKAEEDGLQAYVTPFGWALDLNGNPDEAVAYLNENAIDIFDDFLGEGDNFELINLAREFREYLKNRGFFLQPQQEKINPLVPDPEKIVGEINTNLFNDFRLDPRQKSNNLTIAEARNGFNNFNGINASQAQVVNSVFTSSLFFAPNGNRQYVLFTASGPSVFYNVLNHGADVEIDETDVELLEILIELISLVISLLAIFIGGGLVGGSITKDGLKKVLKTILSNGKLKIALAVLIGVLLNSNPEKLKKGDAKETRNAIGGFVGFIKAIWEEGLIKELLATLGVSATIIGTILFVLWFFGIGELISMILLLVGIASFLKDVVLFLVKLFDWGNRKELKPAKPGSGKIPGD